MCCCNGISAHLCTNINLLSGIMNRRKDSKVAWLSRSVCPLVLWMVFVGNWCFTPRTLSICNRLRDSVDESPVLGRFLHNLKYVYTLHRYYPYRTRYGALVL